MTAAIADYARAWGQQVGVEVEVELPQAIELPAGASRQLLRIVQEALSNVRKHARASRVRVTAEPVGDTLSLLVIDDGAGFEVSVANPSAGGRFGLRTMTERAASIGALVRVGSRPGAGTRVEVTLPASGQRANQAELDARTSG